jgi:hypothetical protein
MTGPQHPGDGDRERLAAAPRRVPPGVLLDLLSRAVLAPCIGLNLAGFFCLPSVLNLKPLSAWRLSQRREQAQGTLTGCGRETNLVFTSQYYQYSFRLPDGAWQTGVSYGDPTPEMEKAHVFERGIPPSFRVPVEYHPEYPRASRIRGTRTGDVSGLALLLLVFPGVVLGILAGQVREAFRKARLLRRGELARATVTACWYYGPGDDREGERVTPEEYRSRWRADHAHYSTVPEVMQDVVCAFTFVAAAGEEVEGRDTAPFDSRPGVPPPALPVLYDPAEPKSARFLHNLGPALRVSETGGWEADVSRVGTGLRFLFALGFALAPAAVWLWWDW